MINTNYAERYMSSYDSKAGTTSEAKSSGSTFADAVGKAESEARSQDVQKRSGKIAESMQKYPQYANDWKREIENE